MEELENGTSVHMTEKSVKERLKLKDAPEEVRSISLPGSYHDKITHLDSSLMNFTRLIKLDFSRNALLSLDGLSHLKNMEVLNVYYNNIPSIDELYRLRHNPKLRELDLRLNPVTKNEPDYRLFLVHVLHKLDKLDDRPVRDNEKATAKIHCDQNKKWSHYREIQQPSETATSSSYKNPRASYVKNDYVKAGLAGGSSAIYDEVEDVRQLLDGLGDAIQSSATSPKSQKSTLHRNAEFASVRNLSRSNQNLFDGQTPQETGSCFIANPAKSSYDQPGGVIYSDGINSDGLTTEDETHANTEYRSLAHFTRAPPGQWTKETPIPTSMPSRERQRNLSSASTVCSTVEMTQPDAEQLKPLLDLVDLYYDGQRSLAKSPAFINKFNRLLSELRPSQDDVKNQLVDREIELRASTNSEKERLKKQLENSEHDNRRLKTEGEKLRGELSSISNNSLNVSTVSDDLVNMLKDSHEMIKKHNMKLESDLAKLKSKYEDEIAQMRASHSQLKSLFMKNSF